jgi:hypothetical protein
MKRFKIYLLGMEVAELNGESKQNAIYNYMKNTGSFKKEGLTAREIKN